MTAAAGSPIAWRSIIRTGWRSFRRWTSSRPTTCGTDRRQARLPHLALDVPRRCPRRSPKRMIGRDADRRSGAATPAWQQGEIAQRVRSARGRALPRLLQRSCCASRRPARTIAPAAPPTSKNDAATAPPATRSPCPMLRAVGRGRHSERSRERSARHLAPMGDRRARLRHRVRALSAGGSAGRGVQRR